MAASNNPRLDDTTDVDGFEDVPFAPALSGALDALGVAREAIDEALAIVERLAGLR